MTQDPHEKVDVLAGLLAKALEEHASVMAEMTAVLRQMREYAEDISRLSTTSTRLEKDVDLLMKRVLLDNGRALVNRVEKLQQSFNAISLKLRERQKDMAEDKRIDRQGKWSMRNTLLAGGFTLLAVLAGWLLSKLF